MPSSMGYVGSILGWGLRIPDTLQSRNQNIKLKQYCGKFKKDLKKKMVYIKKKKEMSWSISRNEAAKAMSGIGGLSAKFFRERRKKRKGRKDKWRKVKREEEIGLSLGWLWKQQLREQATFQASVLE